MNLDEALQESAPNGIDCFFDNVGGLNSTIIIDHMNTGGRIAVVGVISEYNTIPGVNMVPSTTMNILLKVTQALLQSWQNFPSLKTSLQFYFQHFE